jgi:hypothetical protein
LNSLINEKSNFYNETEIKGSEKFKVSMHFYFDDERREEEDNLLRTKLTDSDTYAQQEIRELTKHMGEQASEVEKKYDNKK